MFINARIAIAAAALSLASCDGVMQPIVTNGDISKHLETQGYSKVLIRDRFSCGKAGDGVHFIATKVGKIVTGQVCYLKAGNKVTYSVDEIKPKASNDNVRPTIKSW